MILPKTYVFLLIIAFTFVNLSFTAKIDICTRAGLIDPAVIDASIGSGTTSKTMVKNQYCVAFIHFYLDYLQTTIQSPIYNYDGSIFDI